MHGNPARGRAGAILSRVLTAASVLLAAACAGRAASPVEWHVRASTAADGTPACREVLREEEALDGRLEALR